MNYLDVSPMVASLRTRPDDFEMMHGWLRHTPSRHNFYFGPDGDVRIDARCDCSMLAVKSDQRQELRDAFQQWHAVYWRPIEINREFASHFRPPNLWQRFIRRIVVRLRRALFRYDPPPVAAEAPIRAAARG
jgi:hypothetical protein